MHSSKLRDTLAQYYKNLRGWRTNRKIVVIESDDWGSIRMPSREVYNQLKNRGYNVHECPYNSNDSLECNQDLEFLFELLQKHRGSNGEPVILTANTIVANPDYDRIQQAGFKKYFHEPFLKTLERYDDSYNVFELYKSGINQNIFFPQFHGREHVNINRWLLRLREGDPKLLEAFRNNMFTVHEKGKISGRRDHLDAFGLGYNTEKEIEPLDEIVIDGLRLFKKLFGYKSESMIAPCYIWGNGLEKTLKSEGVLFIQGTHVQRAPVGINGENIEYIRHYLGERNQHKQLYLTRNIVFEPTELGRKDAVDKAMKGIRSAFLLKKPAIISSHRVNYMSRINPENRDQNLRLLDKLLANIVKSYPEVEFMHSS